MNKFIIFLCFIVACQANCFAGVTKLPVSLRDKLINPGQIQEIRTAKDLPLAIIKLCSDEKGRLASVGEDWRSTDVIIDPNLPSKRLIWAVKFDNYYVVHYERGGRAHSFYILFAKIIVEEDKKEVLWRAVGPKLRDYRAFVEALQVDILDDSEKFIY